MVVSLEAFLNQLERGGEKKKKRSKKRISRHLVQHATGEVPHIPGVPVKLQRLIDLPANLPRKSICPDTYVEKKSLIQLVNLPGISGSEHKVREFILGKIKPYVDQVHVDRMGNLIATKRGKGPCAVLAAHMDEVGVVVKYVDHSGHLFISPVGGIEPMTLLGEKVGVITKKGMVYGVITTREIQNAEEITKLPDLKDLYVDTGLSFDELKRLEVNVGCNVELLQEYVELGRCDIFTAKALDDRIGCFMMLQLARKLKDIKNEVHYVFTVQEEIGLYGAKTSLHNLNPDFALVIDVTPSEDNAVNPAKFIGEGPVVLLKDAEMLTNKCLNDQLKVLAKKHKIPLQLEVSDYGTTDALRIAVSKGGIPTAVIGVPVRNIHTSTGIASYEDVKDAIRLAELLLRNIPVACLSKHTGEKCDVFSEDDD